MVLQEGKEIARLRIWIAKVPIKINLLGEAVIDFQFYCIVVPFNYKPKLNKKTSCPRKGFKNDCRLRLSVFVHINE